MQGGELRSSLPDARPTANRLVMPPDLSGRRAEVEGGKSGQRYFQQREGRAGVVVVSLTRRAKSCSSIRLFNELDAEHLRGRFQLCSVMLL